MFIAAAVKLGPLSAAAGGVKSDELRADAAAEAGLQYAMARLAENGAWQGDGDAIMVDTPTLTVIEDRGNVLGLMRAGPDGPPAQFRIRFNYHDGGPSGNPNDDGLADPVAAVMQFSTPYVSVNNLAGGGERTVPRGDTGANLAVSDPTTGPYTVPASQAAILVEGLAGTGLRDQTMANPVPSGRVVKRVHEAYFLAQVDDTAQDASMMGGGEVLFDLGASGSVKVDGDKKATPPRLRAKKEVTVTGSTLNPNLVMNQAGAVATLSGSLPNALGNSKVTPELESSTADFYSLTWGDVKTADEATDPVQLPGGTYVWWSEDNKLHYYDMSWSEYKTYMANPANQADPGTPLSNNLSEVRLDSGTNSLLGGFGKWRQGEDVLIVPSADVSKQTVDFAVVPRSGFKTSPTDTSNTIDLSLSGVSDSLRYDQLVFGMDPKAGSGDSAILSTQENSLGQKGNIILTGDFKSKNGTLTSFGDITVAATDFSGFGFGISMYAQGDIDLSTWKQADGSYKKVNSEGVIYTWGNFTSNNGVGSPNRADFNLKGILVAYGNDPSSGDPGGPADLSGNITITADNVHFQWDKKKLPKLMNGLSLSTYKGVKRTYHTVY